MRSVARTVSTAATRSLLIQPEPQPGSRISPSTSAAASRARGLGRRGMELVGGARGVDLRPHAERAARLGQPCDRTVDDEGQVVEVADEARAMVHPLARRLGVGHREKALQDVVSGKGSCASTGQTSSANHDWQSLRASFGNEPSLDPFRLSRRDVISACRLDVEHKNPIDALQFMVRVRLSLSRKEIT